MKFSSQFTKTEKSESGNQAQQKFVVIGESDLSSPSEDQFSWRKVCEYLNNPERLTKIYSMFLTERNSAIWVYSHAGFEHEGNIASWEHLKVTMQQCGLQMIDYKKGKVNSFPVVKGDRVKLANDDEGVIIKYPSNKEIHILKDGGEILIIVKDDIKSLVK